MRCVDTSFLIDFAKGHPAARAFFEDDGADVYYAPTPALAEAYTGLFYLGDYTTEEAVARFGWTTPQPITHGISIEVARLQADRMRAGTSIKTADAYIAATARSLDVPLIAHDDHFERIDGLDVLTYR
ncbi:PIN domain-containing protein [Halomarina halobia]|uniref:Ribonuclease VapC n=1 Tax=Halomarina halobia TaxID=3033386 RepID=A0ABD6AF69_9EURY|nr:PIN domain-containing protein [Halomarina sp. PSR21]